MSDSTPDEGAGSADAPPVRPQLRIVKGDPTPDELAVLAALVAACGASADAPPAGPRRGGWNDPSVRHRHRHVPGPNAWRAARF